MHSTNRLLVTIGVMVSMLLAAMEALVVTAVMPTIVANLNGLSIYSLVFSVYLFTSTITMPIWGKLSDLYGRGRCFQIGIFIFLLGCLLCGLAQSMVQLILFRAIQGIGAGAILPLTQIIIGAIYNLVERSRMQIIFSGLWVVASLSAPFVGGIITESLSWRWIFYINIPFGLVAALIVNIGLIEVNKTNDKPVIDIAGALTLSVSVILILLGCSENKWQLSGWINFTILFISFFCLVAFVYIEKQAVEPLLPLSLFYEKIFFVSLIANFLVGFAIWGSMPFLTLYAQAVLGVNPTEVGMTLMPLMLGWVIISIVAGKLMLSISYRKLVLTGLLTILIGFFLLILLSLNFSKAQLFTGTGVIGIGLGFSMITLLIAVQTKLPHNLGIVTASILFSRNIGGVIGTAVMSALMNWSLAQNIKLISQQNTNIGKETIYTISNINAALAAMPRSFVTLEIVTQLRQALASSTSMVFVLASVVSLIALTTAFMLPRGVIGNKRDSNPN